MKREERKEGEFEGLDADADSLELADEDLAAEAEEEDLAAEAEEEDLAAEAEEEDLAAEAEEDRLQDLREDEEMLDRQELLQAQEDELVELEDARLAEQS
jgi:hypothetical protein